MNALRTSEGHYCEPHITSYKDRECLLYLLNYINYYSRSETDRVDISNNLSLSKYSNIYVKSLNLIDEINNINFLGEWKYLKQLGKELEQKSEDFVEALKIYTEVFSDESFKMFEETFEEMQITVSTLDKFYNDYLENEMNLRMEEIDEEFTMNSCFCDISQMKNFFVCLDVDERYKSTIEKDIIEDTRINDKAGAFNSFLNLVNELSINSLSSNKGHFVKSARAYSFEFLKKYHIRSYACGQHRLFYGRYATNLDKILPEIFNQKVNIILVFGFKFGHIDGKAKEEINTLALDRCNENKEKIDELIKLFNTDITTLNDQEIEKVKEKIKNIMQDEFSKIRKIVEHKNELGEEKIIR